MPGFQPLSTINEHFARPFYDRVRDLGHAVLAIFPRPVAAIDASTAMRARLTSDLGIRAGIHVGEIERRGTDVAGLAVAIAARVMAFAESGEILVSSAVPPLVVGAGLTFTVRHEVAQGCARALDAVDPRLTFCATPCVWEVDEAVARWSGPQRAGSPAVQPDLLFSRLVPLTCRELRRRRAGPGLRSRR